jgi:hypothetical protein
MALLEEILRSDAERLLLGIDYFLAWYVGRVEGRTWSEGKGRNANYAEGPPPPEEWMPLALSAFATLLDAVYVGMPWRQFAETMLSSVPASPEGKRVLAAAKLRLRKHWTRFFDLDCQGIAAWLREAASTLRQHEEIKRNGRSCFEPNEEEGVGAEMAREPVPFVYRRRHYHFPYLQSVLLSLLQEFQPRNVPELIDELWPGSWRQKLPQYKNRLHQLQRDTNAALLARRLPFEIMRPAANQLQLRRKN